MGTCVPVVRLAYPSTEYSPEPIMPLRLMAIADTIPMFFGATATRGGGDSEGLMMLRAKSASSAWGKAARKAIPPKPPVPCATTGA